MWTLLVRGHHHKLLVQPWLLYPVTASGRSRRLLLLDTGNSACVPECTEWFEIHKAR